jgi:L-fucose isomerase-like protein
MNKEAQMSGKNRIKVGIFSGYDPRPWVMEECADDDIKTLEELIGRIRDLKDYEIVYPGDALSGYDKLCYTVKLADQYAEVFAREEVAVLINVHQTWTFPQLSQKVITSYINKMKAQDCHFVPRIILASIQDTQVPGMVSGMATGGALAQLGISYTHVYGYFDSAEMLRDLKRELDFFGSMSRSHQTVREVVQSLHREHILEFGSFSLQMPTTRIDQEEIMSRWGISSENLDQQVFLDRAFDMFGWQGDKGLSPIAEIMDRRVSKILDEIYDRFPEKFSVIAGREVSRDKFALQLAMYYAIADISEEKGATAATIKCQDECSSRYATCCMATSFLGNDRDLDGSQKRVIPASCETDMPTLISQLFLSRISGKPAGFGDFRYVKTENERTILAVVNCGQHPVYYAGSENDTWEMKLQKTDFPGQEHFYAAGGSAVRMITSGNQDITLARLGVENGRLYLAATVMKTQDVGREKFKQYNQAWPIIEGAIPVTDKVLSMQWPSNHLGFVYGDYLPELIEMAEQLKIGYRIWGRDGMYKNKAS